MLALIPPPTTVYAPAGGLGNVPFNVQAALPPASLGHNLTNMVGPSATPISPPAAAGGSGIGAAVAGFGAALALAFGWILLTPSPTANDEDLMPPDPAQPVQPETYPFLGGQGDGIAYDVTFTVTGPDIVPYSSTSSVWGPVRGVRIFTRDSDSVWQVEINCRGGFRGTYRTYNSPTTQDWYDAASGGQGRNYKEYKVGSISVKRRDNQPDTSGNPPPLTQPITSQPGQPTGTPQPKPPGDTPTPVKPPEINQNKPPNPPPLNQVQPFSIGDKPDDFGIAPDFPILSNNTDTNPNLGTNPNPTPYSGPPPSSEPKPPPNPPTQSQQKPDNSVTINAQKPTVIYGPSSNPGSITINSLSPTINFGLDNVLNSKPESLKPPTEIKPGPVIQTPDPPTEIENLQKDLTDQLGVLGLGLVGIKAVADAINNNTTKEALETAAKNGACSAAKPGGCFGVPATPAGGKDLSLVDAISASVQTGQSVLLTGMNSTLNTVNTKLGAEVTGGISGAIYRFMNNSVVDRVLNLVTAAGVFHNMLMLSNNIGSTFFSMLDNLFAIPQLIFNPDGETIDTRTEVTKYLDSFFAKLFGVTEWTAIKAQWKAYSTIYSSSAQAFNNLREIHNDSQELMNMARNYTAQLGNALVDEGVISEDNWDYKDPNKRIKSKAINRLEKMSAGLEKLDNSLEAIEQVTATLLNITQTANEIKENVDAVNKAIGEANEAAKTDRDTVIEGLELPNFSLDDLF